MTFFHTKKVLLMIIALGSADFEQDEITRQEGDVPWLSYFTTSSDILKPPNLFADTDTCSRNKSWETCHSAFISESSNASKAKVKQGITTNECLQMSSTKKETVLGSDITNVNGSMFPKTRLFNDYVIPFYDPTVITNSKTNLPRRIGIGYFKVLPNKIRKKLEQLIPIKSKPDTLVLRNDEVVTRAYCRIYGWRVYGPNKFKALSMPVKLISTAACRQLHERFIAEGELCIDNHEKKLCIPHAEGAPIFCRIRGKDTLVGMARRLQIEGFNEYTPLIVYKHYATKDERIQKRNNAEASTTSRSNVLVRIFVACLILCITLIRLINIKLH